MVRVFANGPRDLDLIPGQVISKTQKKKKKKKKKKKTILDASLLNTQHYKVRIKSKVGQSWERSSAFPYTLVLWLSKREPSGQPRLQSPTLLILLDTGPLA